MATLQYATAGNLNGVRPASPPGQVDDLGPVILGMGAALVPITIIIAVVRIATGRIISKLHVDDYVCLFTLSLGIAQWAIMYRIAQLATARHAWDIPLTAITQTVYQVWAAHTILGIISFFNTKALILTFYLRLFGTIRWVRRTCYTLLAFSAITYGVILLWYLAGCVPKTSKLPICDETGPLILVGGVFTVMADVLLFVLPFPIIGSLHLSRDKKRGLVVLFLFAIFIIATSTVSLGYRISIVKNGTEDPSWDGAEVAITACVENFGTVIVACAPALYTFWTRIFAQSRFYRVLRPGSGFKSQAEDSDIRLDHWKTWPATAGAVALPQRAVVAGTGSSQDLIQGRVEMGGIRKTVTVTHEVGCD